MKKKILAALLTAVMTFSLAAGVRPFPGEEWGGGVKTPQETRQQEAQTM